MSEKKVRFDYRLLLDEGIRKLRGDGIGSIIARGAGSAFVIKALAAGAAFGSYLVIARLIGVESFGYYVYVLGWISVIMCVSKMGLDSATLRFLPAYSAQGDWPRYKGFVRFSVWVTTGVSLLTALMLAAVTVAFEDKLAPELRLTFLFGSLVLVARTALEMSSFRLQALKAIIQAYAPLHLALPLLLVAGVAVAWAFLRDQTGSHHVMGIYFMAATFLAAVTWFLLKKTDFRETVRRIYEPRYWLRVCLPLLLVTGMVRLLARIDVLMLGAIDSTDSAGIYGAASEVSTLISFGLIAANAIMAPMIAQLHSEGRMEELRRSIRLCALGLMVFTIPAALTILLLGRWILSLFGADFVEGYSALAILCLGQFFNAFAGPVGLLMTMTNYETSAARIFAFAVVANVALNATLIPQLGINGAAIATATTTILWNALMLLFVWRKFRIDPTIFCWLRQS
jgi:O-antigen/teichoic acid export membrane protein